MWSNGYQKKKKKKYYIYKVIAPNAQVLSEIFTQLDFFWHSAQLHVLGSMNSKRLCKVDKIINLSQWKLFFSLH